ncbi:MAG TPA: BTAD domain-containing putative transcriptional regulator [Jatrophihabitans sp.]|nr:BTAD domain-containing putative transcriptional regulator [Jatrophihabitans sp.]
MSDAGGLRVGLLGEFTASYDGAALDLGGPRQRAVLAMLVLHRGQTVSVDRIVEALWADEPPATGFKTLQSYVSHLRRRLEPDVAARSRSGVIVRQARGYAVRLAPDAVDAWEFERLLADAQHTSDPTATLRDALALWRGPALADYAGQPWAEPEITRLEDLRAVARERLAAARVERGDAAVMVGELEAMVADAPLREERWRLLALALYRAHRQADALGTLRRARQTFADELGVDPGPALRDLEAAILSQSPALNGRRHAPLATDAARPGPDAARPGPDAAEEASDLVDRRRELTQLERAVAQLDQGRSTRILLEGPSGIGKTRLLEELGRRAAERGVRVLRARGSQLEQSYGYGVVRQLLEPAVSDELLAGPAAPARAVFDLATEQSGACLSVMHALYSLTANLAAQAPLVVCVDNLQWSDGPSLRFLTYLGQRMDGMPAVLAATLRTGEGADNADLVAELAVDADTVLVRPQPLCEQATAVLVERAFGRAAAPLFVAACHRTTCGNPLLLRQLLQALVAEDVKPDAAHAHVVLAVGSRAVSSQVLMRLRRMPAECPQVARAVAVLGDAAQLPNIATLTGLTERQAAAAIAVLTRAEVLRDDNPVGFVHPLVGEAVYRDLPAAERGLEHERAADLLISRGASAEQVAAHLLLAPHRGNPAHVELLRDAARTAADRGATESAATYLRRALAEPPDSTRRGQVLIELGMHETLIDGPAGTARLMEAYPGVDDPELQVRIAMAIAYAQVFAGERGAAAAFAREAAERLPPGMDDARNGLLALQRISGMMQSVDPALWRDSPAPEPTGQGVGSLMLRAALAWEAVVEGADRQRAVRLAREALRTDQLWEVDSGLLWCVAAVARMYADDDLGDLWLRSRTIAHGRGSLFAVLSVNLWEGVWRWRRGELDEAAALVSQAQEQDRMWGGTTIGAGYYRAALIGIELDRGAVPAARLLLDEAGPGELHGDGARLLRQAADGVLLAEGRFAQALAALDQAADPIGTVNPAWNPAGRLRAAALHGLGRTHEAIPVLEQEIALLRRWGAPTALGLTLTDLGLTTGRRAPLEEAVALLDDSDAALLRGRARLALGTHPDVPQNAAVPLLRAALEAAVDCGAQGVAQQACTALRERGEPAPDVPVPRTRSRATHQRIARLAERGMDVGEIAQALFLTPQTVQLALGEAQAEQPV